MKLMGAALIALACLLWGRQLSRGSRARIDELEAAAAMLDAIAGELEARLSPLPELIGVIMDAQPQPAKLFLQRLQASLGRLGDESFCELWAACVSAGFIRLTRYESYRIMDLGNSLGRYSPDRQLAALGQCSKMLRDRATKERAELCDKLRLRIGLSCSSGALLVILLF